MVALFLCSKFKGLLRFINTSLFIRLSNAIKEKVHPFIKRDTLYYNRSIMNFKNIRVLFLLNRVKIHKQK